MPQDVLLQMEAVLFDRIANIPPGILFQHVLSMPVPCPNRCGEEYIVLMNRPIALEVEMGHKGQRHLNMLKGSMLAFCDRVNPAVHLRTDGEQVWEMPVVVGAIA